MKAKKINGTISPFILDKHIKIFETIWSNPSVSIHKLSVISERTYPYFCSLIKELEAFNIVKTRAINNKSKCVSLEKKGENLLLLMREMRMIFNENE